MKVETPPKMLVRSKCHLDLIVKYAAKCTGGDFGSFPSEMSFEIACWVLLTTEASAPGKGRAKA